MNTITPNPDDLLITFRENARAAAFAVPRMLTHYGYTLVDYRSGELLRDADGLLWKVRVMSDHVAFGPSVAKGAGRSASADKWDEGVDGLAGFIVCDHGDIGADGSMAVWKVPLATLEGWRRMPWLGAAGKCSRATFRARVEARAVVQSAPA
jgi:hypothetical protein